MVQLLLGHAPNFVVRVLQKLPVFGVLALKVAVAAKKRDHGFEVGMGLGYLAVTVLIVEHVRRGQLFFQFEVAFFQIFQLGEHSHSSTV